MAPPTFIGCSESEQAIELRSFLKKSGAEKLEKTEITQQNWPTSFIKFIPHLCVCWKNDKVDEDQSIELLTTVSSMITRLPANKIDEAVDKLCTVYEDVSDKKNGKLRARLYSLNFIYSGLPQEHHSRYRIYRTLVLCGAAFGNLSQFSTQTEFVFELLKVCNCTPAECQALWRQMSDVHQAFGNTKMATQAMINLVSTYPEETADNAHDDIVKCILAAIRDPTFLSYSRLVTLKPVKSLAGEPIHKLLEVYISGDLEDIDTFTKSNPTFLADNALDEKACLDKLRTLVLMEISENVAELDYDFVCKRINLPDDQLETFVVESVRQRVITCKLDQINKRILITGALPRNFGPQQWQNVCSLLKEWESGLRLVQNSLATMVGTVSSPNQ